MNKADFLVELGSEELPPKALKQLAKSFLQVIEKGIQAAQLNYLSAQSFSTPRRLAVLVKGLDLHQPDQANEMLGPPLQAAFDKQGEPTKAAQGFARKCGVAVEQLQQKETNKGVKLTYSTIVKGLPASKLLPSIVEASLDNLPIAKRMRWGESRIEFVRPVHWLVMLLGKDIVDCSILGIKASRESRGHRFHYNKAIDINSADQYQALLESPGYVLADFNARQELIVEQANKLGRNIDGHVIINPDLLDEVTALVEWPVALIGKFDKEFLRLPQEALISSMAEHQKYFHIEDETGGLLPAFITVSNIESKEPLEVVSGNERVIRPRLADAAFFYDTDSKVTLQSRLDQLKNIVFQSELGTLHDKSKRIATLAKQLAIQSTSEPLIIENIYKSGWLCKTDLLSNMVNEFPALQGIMGRYYAINDGENAAVAQAIYEHYLPRFSGDKIPQTLEGSLVSIADKLDTICGLFAINQPPSGDRDPFAIRRAALGILRIMIDNKLDLDLKSCIKMTLSGYDELDNINAPQLINTIFEFMIERFRSWFQDEKIPVDVFLAVYAQRPTSPLDFQKRIYAVNEFSVVNDAHALAAANKRVANILSKQKDNNRSLQVSAHLLVEPQEKELAKLVQQQSEQIIPLLEQGNYSGVLMQLAQLRPAVDDFFDHVMVMVEQTELRDNRLAILQNLRGLFLKVADISLLKY